MLRTVIVVHSFITIVISLLLLTFLVPIFGMFRIVEATILSGEECGLTHRVVNLDFNV